MVYYSILYDMILYALGSPSRPRRYEAVVDGDVTKAADERGRRARFSVRSFWGLVEGRVARISSRCFLFVRVLLVTPRIHVGTLKP